MTDHDFNRARQGRGTEENDWAEQVPWTRHRGPYRDYGWDPGQSALPEFRDPSIHFMPYEYSRLASWQRYYPRQVIYPDDLMNRETLIHQGPYTGRGPRSYQRSDQQLYEQVCDRMMEHGYLDASDINVEVKNGEVKLTGSVADRRQKRLAEDISDSVYGVRDVHNQLQLRNRRDMPESWVDEVGGSGVYPASAAENAPQDASAQGMASWGQGERGARGYEDHGDSELHPVDAEEDPS